MICHAKFRDSYTTLYEYVCYIPMFMDFYKILTLPSVGYTVHFLESVLVVHTEPYKLIKNNKVHSPHTRLIKSYKFHKSIVSVKVDLNNQVLTWN